MKFEDSLGNSVTFADPVAEAAAPDVAQSLKSKAGGAVASQVSGERFVLVCKARTTVAEYRALMDLLKNGSARYYYTPEHYYSLYNAELFPDAVIQPFAAVMSDLQSSWDNRRVHYLTFKITASDFV